MSLLEEINKRVQEKLIKLSRHPSLPLTIYNYSEKCQYEKAWDDITKMCRGIVLDDEGNVVSHPFNKFFNLNEMPETMIDNLPREVPEVREKYDGSLITVFNYKEKIVVTSRGSFESEQAKWASDYINEKFDGLCLLKPNITLCFEAIYPNNRIVVNYKGAKKLMFLAVFSVDPYEELSVEDWFNAYPDHKAKKYSLSTMKEIQSFLYGEKGEDFEGFVCKFSNGLRVKVKSGDYIYLSRMLTGLSNVSCWEIFCSQDVPAGLSDGARAWAKKEVSEFKNKFVEELIESNKIFRKIVDRDMEGSKIRKDIAFHIIENYPNRKSELFALLDGNFSALYDIIQKKLRPSECQKYNNEVVEVEVNGRRF